MIQGVNAATIWASNLSFHRLPITSDGVLWGERLPAGNPFAVPDPAGPLEPQLCLGRQGCLRAQPTACWWTAHTPQCKTLAAGVKKSCWSPESLGGSPRDPLYSDLFPQLGMPVLSSTGPSSHPASQGGGVWGHKGTIHPCCPPSNIGYPRPVYPESESTESLPEISQ